MAVEFDDRGFLCLLGRALQKQAAFMDHLLHKPNKTNLWDVGLGTMCRDFLYCCFSLSVGVLSHSERDLSPLVNLL